MKGTREKSLKKCQQNFQKESSENVIVILNRISKEVLLNFLKESLKEFPEENTVRVIEKPLIKFLKESQFYLL